MSLKKIQLDLSIEETNLILEALGQLPFARVYALIGRIQEGARQQLDLDPNGSVRGNGADRDEPHA
jgi:hypothetical protein